MLPDSTILGVMKAATTTRTHAFRIALPSENPALWYWVLVNVMDAALTSYLLGMGGVEGNPMLSFAQIQLGVTGMLLTKITLATIVGIAIAARGRIRILKAASVFMGVVVVYNALLALYATAPQMTLPFIS